MVSLPSSASQDESSSVLLNQPCVWWKSSFLSCRIMFQVVIWLSDNEDCYISEIQDAFSFCNQRLILTIFWVHSIGLIKRKNMLFKLEGLFFYILRAMEMWESFRISQDEGAKEIARRTRTQTHAHTHKGRKQGDSFFPRCSCSCCV